MHLIYRMGAEHHSWVCDYSYLNAFNLSNGGGASQFLYVSEIAVGRVCFYSYLNAFNLSNGGGASQLGL